ncbi:MAG: DUF3488 domain-containing protein [SAR324 cluster bacterium]|nr:DUF3488 domain-containing protein [SAR324 cluster bacterium]
MFRSLTIASLYKYSMLGLLGLTCVQLVYSQILSWPVMLSGLVLYGCMVLNYQSSRPRLSDRITGGFLIPVLGFCLYRVIVEKNNPVQEALVFIFFLNVIWQGGRAKLEDYWNRHSFLFLLNILTTNMNLDWISFLLFILFMMVSVPVMGVGFLYHYEKKSVSFVEQSQKLRCLLPVLKGTPFVLAAGLLLFFLIPRSPFALLSLSQNRSIPATGYTNQVALLGDGEIQVDQQAMVRVYSPSPEWADRNPSFRFIRGNTLDAFDGRRWHKTDPMVQSFRPGQEIILHRDSSLAKKAVELTFLLEATLDKELFVPWGELIHFNPANFYNTLLQDESGNLIRKNIRQIRTKYETGILPERFFTRLTDAQKARYLQIPTDSWQGFSEFRKWVETVLPQNKDATELTRLLKQHFDQEFTASYMNDFSGEDKLISFLTQEKKGHCEYFASAAVLALRFRGIPSRLAAGYSGGQWNSVSNVLTFNNEHAHVWVEYFENRQWHLFDPTIASPLLQINLNSPSLWKQYVDAISFWIESYMVDYTFDTQKQILVSLSEMGKTDANTDSTSSFWSAGSSFRIKIIVAGITGLLATYWLLRKTRGRDRKFQTYPSAYRMVLKHMESIYGQFPPSLSPKDILYTIQDQMSPNEQEAARTIIDAYYAFRYGQKEFKNQMLTNMWLRAAKTPDI